MFYLYQVEITFENISQIVASLAATIASVAAIIGISTWKKQLIVKAEFDLAKRMMKSIYDLRNAVDYVRQPFQSSAEIEFAKTTIFSKGDLTHDDNIDYKVQLTIYSIRWEKIVKSQNEINSLLLEAEALWGESIVEKTDGLYACIHKLYRAIDNYLFSIQYPDTINKDELIKWQRIMKATGGFSDSDEFREEVDKSIEVIKEFIRPKLLLTKR